MNDYPFNRNLKKPKRILRSISTLLILSIAFQELAFAAGSPVKTPSIPQELGDIRKRGEFPSDKLIINIQDAHAQLGAQESIANILDDLVKRYDLKLVSLEGASGHVDTSLVSSFPNAEVRRKTAETLLKRGQISAGEFYSMVSENRVTLYGVEDESLYEENLAAFRELAEKRPAVMTELKRLRAVVASLESVFYPGDLKHFLAAKRRFRHSLKGFSEYWKQCRALADERGIRYEDYPNLVKLNGVLDLENGIDFKKASQERDLLIEELSRLLPKRSVDELILLALDYKKEKVSDVRFHRSLLGMARDLSLLLHGYPNLSLYTGYLERYERIHVIELLGELEHFESGLRKTLETTPYSQELSGLSERARLLTALLDVSLESADYEKYLSLNGREPLKTLRRELEGLCRVSGKKSFTTVDYKVLEDALPSALRFYEYATRRNRALMVNTLRRMEKENVQVAALITGGFHSDGLARLLNEEKVSHLVVMPKFDDKSGERPYITILTQKPKEYEAMFKNSEMYLAAPSGFDTASPSGARLANTPVPLWKEAIFDVLTTAYLEDNTLLRDNGSLDPTRMKEYLSAYEKKNPQFVSPKKLERYLRTIRVEERGSEGLVFTLYGEGLPGLRQVETFGVPIDNNRAGKVEPLQKSNARIDFLLETKRWVRMSDLLHPMPPIPMAVAAGARLCGDVLYIGRRLEGETEVLPPRVIEHLRRMVEIHLERGGQAAGIVLTVTGKNGQVFQILSRTVKQKRRDLVEDMLRDFKEKVEARTNEIQLTDIITVMIHSRLATQGDQNQDETQLHPGAPARVKKVFRLFQGQLLPNDENVQAHGMTNGDLFRMFLWGVEVSLQRLRLMLERVHGDDNVEDKHTTVEEGNYNEVRFVNPQGKIYFKKAGDILADETGGDNKTIQRVMHLFSAQGRWDSAVKFGFLFGVLEKPEDTSGGKPLFMTVRDPSLKGAKRDVRTDHSNTFLSRNQLGGLAAIFEKAQENVQRAGIKGEHLEGAIIQEVLRNGLRDLGNRDQRIKDGDQERFVRLVVHAFFHNSPLEAMKLYFSRMRGSSGMGFMTTLDPTHQYVGALRQPMFIGVNRKTGEVFTVSDARAAVERLYVSAGNSFQDTYLLNLKDREGEVAQIGLEGVQVYSVKKRSMDPTAQMHYDPKDAVGQIGNRWIKLEGNPNFEAPKVPRSVEPSPFDKVFKRIYPRGFKDLTGKDIRDIPRVFDATDTDFKDPDSRNGDAVDELTKDLARMAMDGNDGYTQLLVLGEAESQYVGDAFGNEKIAELGALKALLPKLDVKSASANDFLAHPEQFNIGPKTRVLILSQSGQTFSSLDAAAFLNRYLKILNHLPEDGPEPGNVYVMTGEYFSLMGLAVGQEYHAHSPPIKRIITNGSGHRPAESCTVTVAAAHHTLTHVLFRIASNLRKEFPGEEDRPFGMKWTQQDLKVMEHRWQLSKKTIRDIIGVDEKGRKVDSDQHRRLTKAAHEDSDIQTEHVKSLVLVYVLVYLAFAFNWNLLFFLAPVVSLAVLAFALSPLYSHLGYPAVYLWRALRGRWRLDRVQPSPNVVTVDRSPWSRRSIQLLVHALGALSHDWNGLGMAGEASTSGEALHKFKGLVRRGAWVNVIAGNPERVPKMDEAVANTVATLIGMQNMGTPPRIRIISNHPIVNSKAYPVSVWNEDEWERYNKAVHAVPANDNREMDIDRMTDLRFDSLEGYLSQVVYWYELTKKSSSLPIAGWDPDHTHPHEKTFSTQSSVPSLTDEDLARLLRPFGMGGQVVPIRRGSAGARLASQTVRNLYAGPVGMIAAMLFMTVLAPPPVSAQTPDPVMPPGIAQADSRLTLNERERAELLQMGRYGDDADLCTALVRLSQASIFDRQILERVQHIEYIRHDQPIPDFTRAIGSVDVPVPFREGDAFTVTTEWITGFLISSINHVRERRNVEVQRLRLAAIYYRVRAAVHSGIGVQDLLDELEDVARHNPDAYDRAWAAWGWGELVRRNAAGERDPKFLTFRNQALNDRNPVARYFAAAAAIGSGDSRSQDLIVEILNSDETNYRIRLVAAEGAVTAEMTAVVPEMLEQLQPLEQGSGIYAERFRESYRMQIISAIERIVKGRPSEIEGLKTLILQRAQGLHADGRLPGESEMAAYRHLMSLVLSPQDYSGFIDRLHAVFGLPALPRAGADPFSGRFAAYARTLPANINGSEAFLSLQTAVQENRIERVAFVMENATTDIRYRRAAALGLGEMDSPLALPYLYRVLRSPWPNTDLQLDALASSFSILRNSTSDERIAFMDVAVSLLRGSYNESLKIAVIDGAVSSS